MVELWQGCLSSSQGGCHLTIHTGKDLRRLSGIGIFVPKSEQIPHVLGFEKALLPGITQDLQQQAQALAYTLCMKGKNRKRKVDAFQQSYREPLKAAAWSYDHRPKSLA